MAEFLSMTMLSAESVSAAKPQAMQSNEGTTEPDQSFAATLAAEVNGKAPEKSGKISSKTRQNTASDLADSTDAAANEGPTQSQLNNDKAKLVSTKELSLKDEDELISEPSDPLLVQNDKDEAEQSHWLSLLEKAKSLQERLSKAETEGKTTSTKTAVEDEVVVQTLAVKQLSDTTKDLELTGTVAKAKTSERSSGAIALDEKLITEQSAEQHLTTEELKALNQITQSDKNSTAKPQAADPILKQKIASELELTPTDSIDKAEKLSLSGNAKAVIAEQNKSLNSIEKSLKAVQTNQIAEAEKQTAMDAEALIMTTTVSKTQVPVDQSTALLKANAAAAESNKAVETDDGTDSEGLAVHSVTTDTKTSVQAQSAAALLAPAAPHSRASVSESKVTTEDILKQMQTAAAVNQGEQGAASSSGEHSQHSPTDDAVLTVIEQHKGSAPVAAEVNSFSSQLKSNLEKVGSGMTVTSREFVSEASQKQADQLGQKLNLIQPEASNQLKEKMLMMVKDKVHTAEIRLDPSELGSMQIKISLQQDQMSVQFMVQQGTAKELMEQQMPKLKELLQQQGIELSQGSVQQQNQSSGGQDGGRRTAAGTAAGLSQGPSEEPIDTGKIPTKTSDRVVDYYA